MILATIFRFSHPSEIPVILEVATHRQKASCPYRCCLQKCSAAAPPRFSSRASYAPDTLSDKQCWQGTTSCMLDFIILPTLEIESNQDSKVYDRLRMLHLQPYISHRGPHPQHGLRHELGGGLRELLGHLTSETEHAPFPY